MLNKSFFFKDKFFLITLIISTVIKLFLIFFIGDKDLTDEWKILVNNLIENQSLLYHEIEGEKLPSVYMPPLYSFFLYLFYLMNFSNFITVKTILIIQSILSTFSVLILYKLFRSHFTENVAKLLAIVFLFYPLNFYSPLLISSVSLQVFLFCFFLYLLFEFDEKKNYLILGIVSGLLLLIRGEFYAVLIISYISLIFKKKNISKIFITFIISVLIVSPYLYRNHKVFNEVVLTKSSGFNLWRGNNILSDTNGFYAEDYKYPNLVKDKSKIVSELKKNNKLNLYEIEVDNYLKNRALTNIQNNPEKYFKLYIKKFLSYLFYNYESNYPGYKKTYIIFPEIIISIFFLIGIFINIFSNKKNYTLLFITLFYFFIIPVFFILPRYKLFVLPIMCFYIGYLLNYILSKKYFFKKTIK